MHLKQLFAGVLLSFLYISCLYSQDNYTCQKFHENGKYGCKDKLTQQIIVPPDYEEVMPYENGIIVKKGGKYGFYDNEGILRLPLKFDHMVYRSDLLICKVNKVHEIRRFDGSYFTTETFEGFNTDGDKIVKVSKNGNSIYGLRFADGRIELHEEFKSIHPVYCPGETRFRVRLPGNGVIITDSVFNKISDQIFEDIRTGSCRNGYITYKTQGLWGLMNDQFQEITPPVFTSLQPLSRTDSLLALKDGYYGVIDYSGKTVIPFEFDFLQESRYNDEQSIFGKNGIYGVMTWTGDTILPFNFIKLQEKRFLYFVTDRNGKMGVFDNAGFPQLPVEYDDMEDISFSGQLVILRKGGKFGLFINEHIAVPVMYDNLQHQFLDEAGSMFLVRKDGKYGWLNAQGELLNNFMYEDAQLFLNGYSRVKSNGEWLEINPYGNPK